MTKPAVAVNMTWCRPGQVGGSEEYLCRQLLGLPENIFDLEIFAPRGFVAAHPELASRYVITELRHDSTSRLRRMWSESTWLYRRTRRSSLVHHGGGTVPEVHRSPTLLTIHDLQYLEYPQYFRASRLAYLRWVMPRSAQRATLIAVPSAFVQASVVAAYGIDVERVVVVPHGVEATLGAHATDSDRLRSKYGLGTGPLVVLPAVTHPHKGHQFLFDVMERYWISQGVTLVLIGGAGLAENEVCRRLDKEPLRQHVIKLGRVSTADRDGLIAMAEAMVFPSEYEGFGAPVIEAMALGTPVITSDRACLPEVVGDAGVVVPLEVDAWAEVLDDVRSRGDELLQKAQYRLRRFTAEESGAALAAAYRLVAG